MSKFESFIEIFDSYSQQVNLQREYENEKMNKQRMANYLPIKSHRKVFEKIANGISDFNEDRFFILSGAYGTGKSHLLLMLANYFSLDANTPEMTKFFNNYSISEKNQKDKQSEYLKHLRGNGKYLVCVCAYGVDNFEENILITLEKALQKENIGTEQLNSIYKQALKKIDEWKNNPKFERLYKNFLSMLSDEYGYTENQLITEIKNYKQDSLKIFKDIHKNITSNEFRYESNNLVEIIKGLCESEIFKDKFNGIVFLYDELNHRLSNINVEIFQEFGELCKDSLIEYKFPIFFIGTIHKSLTDYSSHYNVEDFRKISDRTREESLNNEGIEEIISSIIKIHEEHDDWKKNISPFKNSFINFASHTKKLKLFEELTVSDILEKIIKNIFPMHPMSTYSLIRLASDLGSNNRSIVTFFAKKENEIGSYQWFISNHNIHDQKNKMNLYTVDNLFHYFKGKFTSSNTDLRPNLKNHVRDFEESLNVLQEIEFLDDDVKNNDLYRRILITMIIYQIIGIPQNLEYIKFGLNIEDALTLQKCLDFLKTKNIIFINEGNKCYTFRSSDSTDIANEINEYMKNPDNAPTDSLIEIKSLLKNNQLSKLKKAFNNEFVISHLYNMDYTEDKRFKKVLVNIKDFSTPNFINDLSNSFFNNLNLKERADGLKLYVICETSEDIEKAKQEVKNIKSDRIVIVIPKTETALLKDVFSLKACFNIPGIGNFTPQENEQWVNHLNTYEENLYRKLLKYEQFSSVEYFVSGSKNEVSKDEGSILKESLLKTFSGKRNSIKSEELNKIYDFKEKKNKTLKEATEKILNFNEMISFTMNNAADSGDNKYLQKVLYEKDLLNKVDTDQGILFCELNHDLTKYKEKMPALYDMLNEIKSEKGNEIELVNFIEKYFLNYGLGYNSLILNFSLILRYFKNNIQIISDINQNTNASIKTYDDLLDLVFYKKYKNAIIKYREISTEEYEYIHAIDSVISQFESEKYSEDVILNVYFKIKAWYEKLNKISVTADFYTKNEIKKLIFEISNVNKVNPYDFILENLQTVYGFEKDTWIGKKELKKIEENLLNDIKEINDFYTMFSKSLYFKIHNVFCVNQNKETKTLIKDWFDNLNEEQKDLTHQMHTDHSKKMIATISSFDSENEEDLILNLLPISLGLYKVEDWGSDYSSKYIETLKTTKEYIENNIFSVHPPKFSITGVYEKRKIGKEEFIVFNKEITLVFDQNDNSIIVKNIESEQEYFIKDDKKFRITNPRSNFSIFCKDSKSERTSKEVFLKTLENKERLKFLIENNAEADSDIKIISIVPKNEEEFKIYIANLIDTLHSNSELSKEEVILLIKKFIHE